MNTEILLTGTFGVGKSSLFNRFIHQEFDDKYYGTIGVRVNARQLEIGTSSMTMKLWDTAGEVNQDKVPINYFKDKDVILYVIDVNRPFTFKNIEPDLNYIKTVAPDCKIIVVGNKMDLLSQEQLTQIETDIDFDWIVSAKTGHQIDELFVSIANDQILV